MAVAAGQNEMKEFTNKVDLLCLSSFVVLINQLFIIISERESASKVAQSFMFPPDQPPRQRWLRITREACRFRVRHVTILTGRELNRVVMAFQLFQLTTNLTISRTQPDRLKDFDTIAAPPAVKTIVYFKDDKSTPTFVLDMIFELARTIENEPHARTRRPKSVLLSFLRVCRSWQPVAERRLYRSISIGKDILTENGDILVLNAERPNTRKLIRTLKNPRFAALVQELSLASLHSIDDWINTYLNIWLISMCPNLEHVDIRGYNDSLRGDLKKALVEKKNLTSLAISEYNLEGKPSKHLCNMVEFVGMMAHWPQLEELRFGSDTLRGSGNKKPFPAPSGVLCPQLRRFSGSLRKGFLNERDVNALHAVSGRRLEIFSAYIEDTEHARVALLRCLAAWAPCLTSVDLDVMYYSKITEPDRSIAAAFPALRSLKYLRLETGCVRPATLLQLPALEVLEYVILPTDHTRVPQALASGLEVSGTKSGDACRLPMLRKISLDFLCEPRSPKRVGKATLKHLYEVIRVVTSVADGLALFVAANENSQYTRKIPEVSEVMADTHIDIIISPGFVSCLTATLLKRKRMVVFSGLLLVLIYSQQFFRIIPRSVDVSLPNNLSSKPPSWASFRVVPTQN
ncbi:hypothetical protein DFH11DRAFT_1545427 [Phellopilus nigrolimitatus]|nr:hypothetical protein DFH11DRAFT_1545427 [Phellopilus nigrolimitatus]